jgi:glycosyltransferase involved in cell wall biosynthesis
MTSSEGQAPAWSIVVITLNEEDTIARCLQSVFEAFHGYRFELVLIDSASTDRTVEIAREFAITIESLPPGTPQRPSANRYLGASLTRGERILFLDGDCILLAGWLSECESAFQTHPKLAGISGGLTHVVGESGATLQGYSQSYCDSDYEDADHLAGSAAYRRDALDRVGHFNPYLGACEEAELGARLRAAGYRLIRLRSIMTLHYLKHRQESIPELLRRLRRGYFTGIGQFVRTCLTYALPTGILWRTLHRYVEFLALLLLGVLTGATSVLYQTITPLLLWSALALILFATFCFQARGWRKPAYYILEWTLAVPCILWGFAKRPRTVDEFSNWRSD